MLFHGEDGLPDQSPAMTVGMISSPNKPTRHSLSREYTWLIIPAAHNAQAKT